jgi:hyperosmotically inducible protein
MTTRGLVRLSTVVLPVVLFTLLSSSAAMACVAPTNDAIRAGLAKDLSKYPGVRVAVDDCVVTLSGTTERLPDKLDATKKAKHYGAVVSVVNNIAVAGPQVADSEIAAKVAKKLLYDRTFQGNVFDWYTVASNNGTVTVSGYAHTPMAKDSALALVEYATGVKDIVDKIEVLPLSTFDDSIRIAAARRIYGGTSFIGSNDPAHPIRIIVENGHVTLEGVVNSQVDRTRAFMAVSGLGGVFSVKNDLVVKRG